MLTRLQASAWMRRRQAPGMASVTPDNTIYMSRDSPVETLCMACDDARCDFKPLALQRRPVGDFDVLIEMKYCGVCHSDLHSVAGHMDGLKKIQYPHVPGHELAGVVAAVGAAVTKVSVPFLLPLSLCLPSLFALSTNNGQKGVSR